MGFPKLVLRKAAAPQDIRAILNRNPPCFPTTRKLAIRIGRDLSAMDSVASQGLGNLLNRPDLKQSHEKFKIFSIPQASAVST
jgi:hypothetical protein